MHYVISLLNNSLEDQRITMAVSENNCKVVVDSSKNEDSGKWMFEVSSAKSKKEIENKGQMVYHNRSVDVQSKF